MINLLYKTRHIKLGEKGRVLVSGGKVKFQAVIANQ